MLVKKVKNGRVLSNILLLTGMLISSAAFAEQNQEELGGFKCYKSDAIVQYPNECVVAYIAQSNKIMAEPINESNKHLVEFYRVLHPKGEGEYLKVSTRYPNGHLRSDAVEITTPERLLTTVFLRDLGVMGRFVLRNESGQMTTSENYYRGKRNGESQTYYDNGNLEQVSNYKDDQFDGVVTSYYKTGSKSQESYYKKGMRDGSSTSWFANGQKSAEQHYADNYLEGESIVWYDNGQKKSEGSFIEGRAVKTYTSWYDSGKKKEQSTFDGNKWVNVTWYPNGQKTDEANFLNSLKDGKQYEWYDNGNMRTESYFEQGNQEGFYKIWDYQGVLRVVGQYHKGLKDGLEVTYPRGDTSMLVLIETIYENGVQKSSKINSSGKQINVFKDFSQIIAQEKAAEEERQKNWVNPYQKINANQPKP